jgi:hypothetical protein
MRTTVGTILGILLLGASVFLVERSIIAGAPRADDFGRAVSDLARNGETPDILGRRSALEAFDQRQVRSLLYQNNRYLKALAIHELRTRGDHAEEAHIARIVREQPFNRRETVFDPHGFIGPDSAVLLASAEYVARFHKSSSLPAIWTRREISEVPCWFLRTFRHMDAGWIRASAKLVHRESERQALSYLISATAKPENTEELSELLEQERGTVWEGAVRACERLNLDGCWSSLDASLSLHDPREQLIARMSQFRKGKASEQVLFSAARAVAAAARAQPSPDAQAALLMTLYEFLGLAHTTHLRLPASLIGELQQTGSPAILAALDSLVSSERAGRRDAR